MRETEIAKDPSRPWNPHSYAVFAQVHNTLYLHGQPHKHLLISAEASKL
jgi:hypothetical protein